jgi:hypothetical protein
MYTLKKILPVLLSLLVLVSGLGMAEPQVTNVLCSEYYVVGKSDTLSRIASSYDMSLGELLQINSMPASSFTFMGQKLCVSWDDGRLRRARIDILSTARDTSVSIEVHASLQKRTVLVSMGPDNPKAFKGTYVGTFKTDVGGHLKLTLNIPAKLKGVDRIGIRVVEKGTAQALYRSFWNINSGPKGYSDFPTVGISSYTPGKSIGLTTYNTPPHLAFNVLMVPMVRGERVKAYKLGTWSTGTGGTLSATYNVPAELLRVKTFVIGLQDPNSGCFAYTIYPAGTKW